ncbi:Formate efflux transporter [Clostridiaceae bacterium JG1575]|nr:Formate efflux transporter [Clostridiaceae bacterium JG1575]
MYQESIQKVSDSAASRLHRMEHAPGAFLVLSAMAGLFIGFATVLTFTLGGLFQTAGSTFGPLVMGLSFASGLSLVIFAGSELFTGNLFIMSTGYLLRKVSLRGCAKLLVLCYLGNLLGSLLLGWLFVGTGLAQGATGDFFIKAATIKSSLPASDLIFRGVLCNVLVCASVWTNFHMKSESGKLIMIFWCLFAFITPGFEHCIANMGTHAVALMIQGSGGALSLWGAAYNIFFSTVGNIIGGCVFMGMAYSYVALQERAQDSPVKAEANIAPAASEQELSGAAHHAFYRP